MSFPAAGLMQSVTRWEALGHMRKGNCCVSPPGLSTRRAARALRCDTFRSASPLVDLERGFCRGNRPGVRSKPWLKTNPSSQPPAGNAEWGWGDFENLLPITAKDKLCPGSRVEQGRHFSFKLFFFYYYFLSAVPESLNGRACSKLQRPSSF